MQLASSTLAMNVTERSARLDWYKIRDMMFGQNCVKQDLKCALDMACACEYPDARWLSEIFFGKEVRGTDDFRDVFLSQGKKDSRALCFAALLSKDWNIELLQQSADLGYSFAQAILAKKMYPKSCRPLAQKSADQGERDGFFMMGRYFCEVEQNKRKGKENYLIAAELGLVGAMISFGNLLDEFDSCRWFWFGRAAQCGVPYFFMVGLVNQANMFARGWLGCGMVTFAIGRALKGNVNSGKKEIFGGFRDKFEAVINFANHSIAFCDSQLEAARKAIDTWAMIGLQFRFPKDLRLMIGKMIWEARYLAEYTVRNCNNN